jgi:hypothetical protein
MGTNRNLRGLLLLLAVKPYWTPASKLSHSRLDAKQFEVFMPSGLRHET